MSRKKSNKAKGGEHALVERFASKIRNFLDKNLGKSYSLKQLYRKLDIHSKIEKQAAMQAIYDLENLDVIRRLRNGGVMSTHEPELMTGRVDHVSSRFAYVIVEGQEEDIWVRSEDMNNAIDGDIVRIMQTSGPSTGKRPEGKIVEVVKRSKESFVGRVELSTRYAFVVPDNKKIHFDIFVKLEKLKGAKHNDKVVVKVTEWPEREKNPTGEVTEVLGQAGENEAEIHSIMAEFELPFRFEQHILKAAEAIPEEISEKEIKKRKDMRDVVTFTIDPADAKDFDDALSVTFLEDGNFEIGVHIADVTHYVQPDTPLEEEAFERATSVYLVDRTIPMLPEKLSNNLCSLRPNEDKLTFSAVFVMDKEANIKSQWFGRTIIHSDRRFAYEEAQEVIENKEGDHAKEITLLNDLAHILRKKRLGSGAVNFETVEVKFQLDEKGKPLAVIPKVRKDAHKMIEEFMLLANKKVAEFIYGMKKGKEKNTFVYRTHDYPDPDKVNAFSVFARKFGYQLRTDDHAISSSLNTLIDSIEGKPEQNVLQQLAIRTMAKAKYTTEAKGHFGLAFDHYTHFTSPIRRYPDMMVHRLLQHYLDQGKSANKDEYEDKCLHSSEREKRAADAERASIKYKQVEFMSMMATEDKVWDGIVSGVTEWGVYIEIVETKCEGMVRMADMLDDYYEFDEENYRIIGKRSKKIIQLGDDVKVKVKKTDIDKRTIDLIFVK